MLWSFQVSTRRCSKPGVVSLHGCCNLVVAFFPNQHLKPKFSYWDDSRNVVQKPLFNPKPTAEVVTGCTENVKDAD